MAVSLHDLYKSLNSYSIANVNCDAASQAFKSHRKLLMEAILENHSVQLANDLYAEGMISPATKSELLVPGKTKEERNVTLLDAIEARILTNPSDFNTLLGILEADILLCLFADKLRTSYHQILNEVPGPDVHRGNGVLEYGIRDNVCVSALPNIFRG